MTTTHHDHLPQLGAEVFLTDGGIETTLIFGDGFDLPDFAAFPLLADDAGRAALVRYFESYVAVAVRDRVGIVLETATWRASADWGARLGWTPESLAAVNRDAVAVLRDVRARHATHETPIVISGCLGPRGDGYQVHHTMSAAEAQHYHAPQVAALVEAGVDLVTAMTMTYVDEAIGIVDAARAAGVPVVIAFTVETDGHLPSGTPLGEAIAAVDAATGGDVAYYMVNCAHPTHLDDVLDGPPAWAGRLGGLRANASAASHAELDAAEELDAGDPDDLARRYVELRELVPTIRVLGGCCGTDHRHIGAISAAVGALV